MIVPTLMLCRRDDSGEASGPMSLKCLDNKGRFSWLCAQCPLSQKKRLSRYCRGVVELAGVGVGVGVGGVGRNIGRGKSRSK